MKLSRQAVCSPSAQIFEKTGSHQIPMALPVFAFPKTASPAPRTQLPPICQLTTSGILTITSHSKQSKAIIWSTWQSMSQMPRSKGSTLRSGRAWQMFCRRGWQPTTDIGNCRGNRSLKSASIWASRIRLLATKAKWKGWVPGWLRRARWVWRARDLVQTITNTLKPATHKRYLMKFWGSIDLKTLLFILESN